MCPCVQKVQRLPLALMTLVVASPRVYTVHGVPLSVTGIAQVSEGRMSVSIRSDTATRLFKMISIIFCRKS